MSKFIKRIGTTATKYMFEFSDIKVELNLIQPCKIGLILKRGDHVEETKKSIPLEKGSASFPDKLGIPATLYFDKKKNCYITKEASITINVVTSKVTRLAGMTKIDLAQFANKGVTAEEMVQSIEKCFDKNAKLHYTVKMVKVSDVIAERKSHRKGTKDKKKTADKSDAGNSENKDRSESPFASQINEDSDAGDFTDNSSLPDFSQERRGKSPDFKVNYNSDNELAVKGRTKTAEALKLRRSSISDGKSAPNRFATEAFSDITSVNESIVQPQNVLELEVKAKNYQRENKELYAKIQENNEEYLNLKQDYEDLKLKYDKLRREYDSVLMGGSKRTEKATTFGPIGNEVNDKDRIAELEKEVQELTKERDEANERADELQQSTQDLLVKIESYKSKEKKSAKGNSPDIEEYIVKVNDLQQKLKESEIIIKELSNPQKKDGHGDATEQLELENQMLKTKIEQHEEKIEELEKQLGIQLKELEIMKKMRNRDDTSNQALEQMEKKQKGLEETYKKRIDDLTKQNTDLKKELEDTKGGLSSIKLDTEDQLARLSLENENLKRQMKEANGKLINAKYDNKETEEMRRKLVQFENEKEKLDSELIKAKMGWASSDKEKDEATNKLKALEQSSKEQKERNDMMESEVFRLRTRMAELMNVVMEFGEMELLDKIEQVITQDGQSSS